MLTSCASHTKRPFSHAPCTVHNWNMNEVFTSLYKHPYCFSSASVYLYTDQMKFAGAGNHFNIELAITWKYWKCQNTFTFLSILFIRINVPQLPYPFFCRWTSRLRPCPSYFKQPVLWDNPEGWGREGGGRGLQDGGSHVRLRLICVNVWLGSPKWLSSK